MAGGGRRFPARGLWEMKMSFEKQPARPPQSIQQCIDAATDLIMQSSASNKRRTARKRDVVKSGDTTTINSVCSVAGRNATSRAVVTGSLDGAYTMTVASKSDVGPRINMTIRRQMARPYQADQKPASSPAASR